MDPPLISIASLFVLLNTSTSLCLMVIASIRRVLLLSSAFRFQKQRA